MFTPQNQCFISNRKSNPGITAHGGTLICEKKLVSKLDFKVNGSVRACLTNLANKTTLNLAGYLSTLSSYQGEALNVPTAFLGLWSSNNIKKLNVRKNKMKFFFLKFEIL